VELKLLGRLKAVQVNSLVDGLLVFEVVSLSIEFKHFDVQLTDVL